jgi:probable phosphoglycerate mutase
MFFGKIGSMEVFLVRHAQSDAHSKGRRQAPDSSLSERGSRQALALARRLKLCDIDLILTSKLPRAKQTAEIMAKVLAKPLEIFEGIHEREQHPSLYGASYESRIHNQNVAEIAENMDNLDWKFRGRGESIRQVIKRAVKFKKHLEENHLDQNLLVISHGIFIRCFVAACILGENYQDDGFIAINRSLRFDNAGVSLLEYDEDRKSWEIKYLNDCSHLN